MKHSLFIVLLIAGILLFLKGRGKGGFIDSGSADKGSITQPQGDQENRFSDMRNMALNLRPEQLKLNVDTATLHAFGIIVEIGVQSGCATIVALESGDVSIYMSNGTLYIGGFAHEEVKNAGMNLLREAQNYLKKAVHSDLTPLPANGQVKFYFLTTKGRYVAGTEFADIEKSEYSVLYARADLVITAYRKLTKDY